ncbi:MAG: uroporphyrinogen-III synthase [Pseudonocardiaceae bacterium]|nr:uroporphyrinogen-III synthase [Pseudonocardiaceae bacterium]
MAGFTVGLTAARRADELEALLARRGAAVLHGPAIRIVPLPDDLELYEATRWLATERVDFVVATTGIGFRGWVEAAEGWGLGADLLRRLGAATVLARGPKARGAVRAAGLVESWSPESESSAEILDHLLRSGVDGRRVAVQLHGEPLPEFVDRLRAAGAEVVEVPVYRWAEPVDPAPLDRLVDAALARQVDALAFTSAPAAASVLDLAHRSGRGPALLDALRQDVLAACVGTICARPFREAGVPVAVPERARLGSLVRAIAESLPQRAQRIRVANREVELRGYAAIVDGELRPLAPTPMAVLRALAVQPGRVVSRRELIAALPNGGETHAVETAIARLRTALGVQRLVQTVVKRGYRLAVDQGRVRA